MFPRMRWLVIIKDLLEANLPSVGRICIPMRFFNLFVVLALTQFAGTGWVQAVELNEEIGRAHV